MLLRPLHSIGQGYPLFIGWTLRGLVAQTAEVLTLLSRQLRFPQRQNSTGYSVYPLPQRSRDEFWRVVPRMNGTATSECQTLDVKRIATELGVCEETIRRLVRRKVLRKLP